LISALGEELEGFFEWLKGFLATGKRKGILEKNPDSIIIYLFL